MGEDRSRNEIEKEIKKYTKTNEEYLREQQCNKIEA